MKASVSPASIANEELAISIVVEKILALADYFKPLAGSVPEPDGEGEPMKTNRI